jgi:hypothetical protein
MASSIEPERAPHAAPPRAPLSAHPTFAALVAAWFAALLGLGTLIVPAGLLERVTAATGLAGRGTVAAAAAVVGGLLGLLLARWIAKAQARSWQAAWDLAGVRRRPLYVAEDVAPSRAGQGDALTPDGDAAPAFAEDFAPEGLFDAPPAEEAVAVDDAFAEDAAEVEAPDDFKSVAADDSFTEAAAEVEAEAPDDFAEEAPEAVAPEVAEEVTAEAAEEPVFEQPVDPVAETPEAMVADQPEPDPAGEVEAGEPEAGEDEDEFDPAVYANVLSPLEPYDGPEDDENAEAAEDEAEESAADYGSLLGMRSSAKPKPEALHFDESDLPDPAADVPGELEDLDPAGTAPRPAEQGERDDALRDALANLQKLGRTA